MKIIWTIVCSMTMYMVCSQKPNWVEIPLSDKIEISQVAKDANGFLWLSSNDQLSRFDGSIVQNKAILENQQIISLKSVNGVHYIGTDKGTIMEYNPPNDKIKTIIDLDTAVVVTDFYMQDQDNYVLLSYGYGVVLTMNNKKYHITTTEGLSSNEVYEVIAYRGQYYIATDQGISIIRPRDNSFELSYLGREEGLSDVVITHFELMADKLWYSDYNQSIGSIDSLGIIHNFPLDIKAQISDIKGHLGRMMVATDQGIYRLEDHSWEPIFLNETLNSFTNLIVDEEDNLWAFDTKNKVYRASLKFEKILFSESNVSAISKNENTLYLSNNEGLFSMQGTHVEKISDHNVTALKFVKDYLIVGTFSEGVFVYDKHNELVDSKNNWVDISNESVLSIYTVDSTVYVSSLSGVVKFTLNNGKLVSSQSLSQYIGQPYVYTMLQKGDYMYFGTDRSGLIKWNITTNEIEEIKNFGSGEKIGSVYSMTVDSTGMLWFTSTEKTLAYLKDNEVVYLKQLGNNNDEYTSIAHTPDNRILLIRSKSIDILDPSTKSIMYYDRVLGLAEEIPFLNTVIVNEQQTYFLHDNNIYIYNSIPSAKRYPKVVIDEVFANLSPVYERRVFSQNENNIEIVCRGVWLSNPLELVYRYKLEGFDEEWRTTRDHVVTYPKLLPGSYVFSVSASVNGQFDNQPISSLSFQIKKYFYNYLWARLLFIVLILYLAYRWWKNIEDQKKERAIQEKLIVENQLINLKKQLDPHFLFNAFNTLVGLVEEDTARSIIFIERLADFYRTMLELGKENLISLDKEIFMLEQYIGILKERFDDKLQIDISLDDHRQWLIPPMTLQLLIENAVKHNVISTKKPLTISIKQSGSKIYIWNNKNELIMSKSNTQTGLNNIFKRFELAGLVSPVITNALDYYEVVINLKNQ